MDNLQLKKKKNEETAWELSEELSYVLPRISYFMASYSILLNFSFLLKSNKAV